MKRDLRGLRVLISLGFSVLINCVVLALVDPRRPQQPKWEKVVDVIDWPASAIGAWLAGPGHGMTQAVLPPIVAILSNAVLIWLVLSVPTWLRSARSQGDDSPTLYK